MPRYPSLISPKLIRFISDSNPKFSKSTQRFLFNQSSRVYHAEFPIPRTQFVAPLSTLINPNPNFQERDFDALCSLLTNPDLLPGSDLENALNGIQIKPTFCLLVSIFKRLDSLPKQSRHDPYAPIFNLMLNILAKSGEFNWVLMVLLDKIKKGDGSRFASFESFGFLLRHCAHSGMVLPDIHTFEFARNLEIYLFEVLIAALCKFGHVEVATECVDRKICLDPNWVPSIAVYNMLLDGWFRVGKIEQVEELCLRMRREKLIPVVVTYDILVVGYCRMGLVDRAIELLSDMRRYDVRPDREIYGAIVDALAQEGRFKEALGMLERFLVLESGPTLWTYNSLVKGFCEAEDLVGAGNILKMMTSRGVLPTAMTYSYFFRYFAKHGKIDEGVNLYRKMLESGYVPDQQTFHLLLKMVCEQENWKLAIQISKEMKLRGYALDLATSTMLIDLLCKTRKFKEAVTEFEDMIERGVVPEGLTYETLHNELKTEGLHDLARKLSQLAATVPSLATLPMTYKGLVDISRQRRQSIIQRAKTMSDVLKRSSDPREHTKCGRSDKFHFSQ